MHLGPLVAIGCCWMALDLTGRGWMQLVVVGCCWMSLGVVGRCWMSLDSLDAVGCSGLLLGVVGCHRVLLDVVGSHCMLLDATERCCMPLDALGCGWVRLHLGASDAVGSRWMSLGGVPPTECTVAAAVCNLPAASRPAWHCRINAGNSRTWGHTILVKRCDGAVLLQRLSHVGGTLIPNIVPCHVGWTMPQRQRVGAAFPSHVCPLSGTCPILN